MQSLGFNYRLTDFQAALGISQLKRAEEGLTKRKYFAQKYIEKLSEINDVIFLPPFDEGNAYHLFVIQIERRRELYEYLRELDVYTQIHYFPVHLMPYYQQKGWKSGDFPNAEKYYSECISLPLYPTLTENEFNFIIDSIKKFYSKYY